MAGFPATILRAREREMNEFITTILHESGPATKGRSANTNMSAGANCHYAEIRMVQLRPELPENISWFYPHSLG